MVRMNASGWRLVVFAAALFPLVTGIAECGGGDQDGDGYTVNQGDCDDDDASIHPGAAEVCDGVDNDCDGSIDVTGTGDPPDGAPTWYEDADGDGYGDPAAPLEACAAPAGYVSNGTDNCPAVANPDQADLDGDGVGDACLDATDCGDLIEEAILERWSWSASDGAATTLTVLDGSSAAVGAHALRAVTASGFSFALRYAAPTGTRFAVTGYDELRFAVRASNTNSPTWQGNFPTVTLEDSSGRRRTYTPSSGLLPEDGLSWKRITVDLAGSSSWSISADSGLDLRAVVAIELGADTWGSGFTLDVDGLSFEHAGAECPVECPADCSGRGTCDAETFGCVCDLGAAGSACETCADGFVEAGDGCVLEQDGDYASWPNPVSAANSDPWLAVHHASIEKVRPSLLVVNFVNPSDPAAVTALIDQLVAGFGEGSRVRGYADAGAPVQLEYQLAKGVIDLRDGVNGRPPAPSGYPYENSTLYPRRDSAEEGYWRFDYAQLFDGRFAGYYGYADPEQPGRYLSLCELIDQGMVHELWVVGSGDVPDVNAAEVLESKQRYTSSGNRIDGSFDRCAGNGCFDADVPACARSVRIGWVNYNRGPGCYLHSQGHGIESTGSRQVVPALSDWFIPFTRFDLDSRYGMPFSNLYGLDCSSGQCLEFISPETVAFHYGGADLVVYPYDGGCGNVHFPPNGVNHYDYGNTGEVLSSCEGFGRHAGQGGADALSLVNVDDWAMYTSIAPDCGGEFLVWWYQNMPGYGSGQRFENGSPMPSMWPFLFY